MTITVPLDELLDDLGVADTDHGGPVTADEARRLACTAGIIPAVLGKKSEVLDLGRTARLFSPAQRKALTVGHPHCRAEGCTVPAAWCDAPMSAFPGLKAAAPTSPTGFCCATGTTDAPTTTATPSTDSSMATSATPGAHKPIPAPRPLCLGPREVLMAHCLGGCLQQGESPCSDYGRRHNISDRPWQVDHAFAGRGLPVAEIVVDSQAMAKGSSDHALMVVRLDVG